MLLMINGICDYNVFNNVPLCVFESVFFFLQANRMNETDNTTTIAPNIEIRIIKIFIKSFCFSVSLEISLLSSMSYSYILELVCPTEKLLNATTYKKFLSVLIPSTTIGSTPV